MAQAEDTRGNDGALKPDRPPHEFRFRWGLHHSPLVRLTRRLISDSPFLAFSIAFHALVLGALAAFTATRVEAPQKRVVLEVEQVEITAELRPLRREENLFDSEPGALGVARAETYDAARESMEQVEVERVDVLAMDEAMRAGQAEDFEPVGHASPFSFAVSKQAKGMASAVDQFAVITLNAARRQSTLVCFLIDRSRSIIYQHLPEFVRRMDHYFKETDLNLAGALRDRMRWLVVSYGQRYQFVCPPTGNMEEVKGALKSISIDTSGRENVGAAIKAVLNRYADQYGQLVIAVMTDEAGDDIRDPEALESIIRDLVHADATVCVFGYESTFALRRKVVRMKLDPEVLSPADRARVRGFEGQTVHQLIEAGPECPMPELWEPVNRWRAQQWGGDLRNIPSGFGMYPLNRMAMATGGVYFDLKGESDYDQDKLYARYKPDLCSVHSYVESVRKSEPKRELFAIWEKLPHLYLDKHLTSRDEIQAAIQKAGEAIQFCSSAAENLQDDLGSAGLGRGDRMRWRAHAELTLAELVRLQFMLNQYAAVLSEALSKLQEEIPDSKWLVVQKGKAPGDIRGGNEARQAYEHARSLLQQIRDKHANTPWAEAANVLQQGLCPWTWEVRNRPKGGPRPPELAF